MAEDRSIVLGTPPAERFTQCGKLLCGPGPRWKEQFADRLGLKVNSVDNMSKGVSRIPPGVWRDVHTALVSLYNIALRDLPALLRDTDGYATEVPQARATTV